MKEGSPLLVSASVSRSKVVKPASNSLSALLASLKGQSLAALEAQTRHVDWSAPVFTTSGQDKESRSGVLVHPWVCVLRSQNLEACYHFMNLPLSGQPITVDPFSTGPRYSSGRFSLASLDNVWGWGVLGEALKLGMPDQARALLPRSVENLMQAPHQATELLGLAKAFVRARGLTQEDTVDLIQTAGHLLEQAGYAQATEFLPARILDEACKAGDVQLVQWLAAPPLSLHQTYAHAISLAKAGGMEQAFEAINHARATKGGADKTALVELVSHTLEYLRFAASPAFKAMPRRRAQPDQDAAVEMAKWLLLRHSRATSKGYLDEAFGWDADEDTASKLSVMASFVPSEWVLPTFRGREFPPETIACLLADGRGRSEFAQCVLAAIAPRDVGAVVEKTVKKLQRGKAWTKSASTPKLVAIRSMLLLEAIEPLAVTRGLDAVEILTPHLPLEVRGSAAAVEVWKKTLADYRAAQLNEALEENVDSPSRKLRF